jgi:pseudouridine kinase
MTKKGLVVVVGGMNMDVQGRSYGPFRPGDSNPGATRRSPGGVGRNIAENLCRLGVEVELVSVLGDDPFSSELEASCAALRIGLSGTLRLPGREASQYLCLLDSDGRLAGAVAAMSLIDELSPEVLASQTELFDKAEFIIVDANLRQASIGWLAERYRRGQIRGQIRGQSSDHRLPRLVLDPVSVAKAARARPHLASFSFAKPNLAEAEVLASAGGGEVAEAAVLEADSAADAKARAAMFGRALLGRGLGEVFISLGAGGLYYEGPGEDSRLQRGIVLPPSSVPVEFSPRNVSGAGDAACAALVWGALEGFSVAKRAGLALAAAILAASTDATVRPDTGAAVIERIAEGVRHEPLS